jgi:hypothetical protein
MAALSEVTIAACRMPEWPSASLVRLEIRGPRPPYGGLHIAGQDWILAARGSSGVEAGL